MTALIENSNLNYLECLILIQYSSRNDYIGGKPVRSRKKELNVEQVTCNFSFTLVCLVFFNPDGLLQMIKSRKYILQRAEALCLHWFGWFVPTD